MIGCVATAARGHTLFIEVLFETSCDTLNHGRWRPPLLVIEASAATLHLRYSAQRHSRQQTPLTRGYTLCHYVNYLISKVSGIQMNMKRALSQGECRLRPSRWRFFSNLADCLHGKCLPSKYTVSLARDVIRPNNLHWHKQLCCITAQMTAPFIWRARKLHAKVRNRPSLQTNYDPYWNAKKQHA